MYKIRLSNGEEYPARFCSARGGLLTMSIQTDRSFLAVAHSFADYSQTVIFIYDSTQETFEGYTELVMINGIEAGEYLITLRQEANS